MLKCFIKFICRKKMDSNIDIFAEFFKYEFGLSYLVSLRILLYNLILVIISLITDNINKTLSNFFTYIGLFIILILLIDITKPIRKNLESSYLYRSKRITNYIIGHFLLTKFFLSKQEWDKVKSSDIQTYSDLVSGYCKHKCYSYARKLALLIENVTLMYISIQPIISEDKVCAHAIIRKNNQIYDTNIRRSFDIDDYFKLFNVKVYHEWNFNEYSQPDFKDSVSKDFHAWCKSNNVTGYHSF